MENLSINFIKYRIENNYCDDMKGNTYDNFQEVNPIDYLKNYFDGYDFKKNALEYTIKSDDKNINVSIEYNPYESFEYFTSEACVCDGTLVFFDELT